MKLNRFVISMVMLTCSSHVIAGDSLDVQQSKFEQRLLSASRMPGCR